MKYMNVLFLSAAIAVSFAANAGTLNKGYAFCLSEKALDQLTTAQVNNDSRMINQISETFQCAVINQSFEFTVIDSGWFVSNVRVWVSDSEYVDVWVPNEAIQ